MNVGVLRRPGLLALLALSAVRGADDPETVSEPLPNPPKDDDSASDATTAHELEVSS